MSRKTLLFIIAVIEAIVIALGDQLGIKVDKSQLSVVLLTAMTMIFGNTKVDQVRGKLRREVARKWRKPEFWIALIGIVSPFLQKLAGINIPAEWLAAVIPSVLAGIFGLQYRNAK